MSESWPESSADERDPREEQEEEEKRAEQIELDRPPHHG